jgi:sulfur carrier protein
MLDEMLRELTHFEQEFGMDETSARLGGMPLMVILNGQDRTFEDLASPVPLDQVIGRMDLKADRIAVEHNGEIAHRDSWSEVRVSSGDRLEIVHFVGGGLIASVLNGVSVGLGICRAEGDWAS